MSSEQRDIFDELFALLDPALLLNDDRASGEGVRVCVVDSGLERTVLEDNARKRGDDPHPIEGGVFQRDSAEPMAWDGHQSTPHGTTVGDVILTIAPRVQLYSADVFGPQGSSEIETVMHAVRWAVQQWNCHIVNLSLGVTEQRLPQIPRRHQLLKAVEEAYYQDVLVFAAAHNEHPLVRSYPSAFGPSLISVTKGEFDNGLDFTYHLQERIEFRARSLGYFGPFAHEPATSWAAPHLAGIAARLLSLRPGLKPFELKTLLYWMSVKHPNHPQFREDDA